MTPITLHPIIFYFLLGYCLILMGFIGWIVTKWFKFRTLDSMIFIDPSNRWIMVKDKLKDVTTYTHNAKKYILNEKSGLVSNRGKVLYIFSENKPQPMAIEYNKEKWLSSDSMMSVINNKLIQKLVSTSDSLTDNLMLMGAIGGMISGISCVLILLKQFGVI